MKNQVIGLYLRLSDEDDRESQESNSITSQREILKNYVRNHRETRRTETAGTGKGGRDFCHNGKGFFTVRAKLYRSRQLSGAGVSFPGHPFYFGK